MTIKKYVAVDCDDLFTDVKIIIWCKYHEHFWSESGVFLKTRAGKNTSHAPHQGNLIITHIERCIVNGQLNAGQFVFIVILFLGSELITVGWGSGQSVQVDMQQALMTTLSLAECNHPLKGWKEKVQSSMLCASGPQGYFCRGIVQLRNILEAIRHLENPKWFPEFRVNIVILTISCL